jgi:hypothetical protein
MLKVQNTGEKHERSQLRGEKGHVHGLKDLTWKRYIFSLN